MSLTLARQGETAIVVSRHFAAAPEQVYRAHVEPELLRQWLTGPEGWRMTRCDHGPNGEIRYDWEDPNGNGFYLTGEFLLQEPFRRLKHIERLHLPQQTPENRVETLFEGDGSGGTNLRIVMEVASADIREAMMDTDMASGMEQSYLRLDAMLA